MGGHATRGSVRPTGLTEPNSCLTSSELEGCRFHRLSCRSTELAVDLKSHSPQARSLLLSYPAAKNLELSKLLRCPRRTSNIKPADRTFPSPPGRSATGEVPDPHDRQPTNGRYPSASYRSSTFRFIAARTTFCTHAKRPRSPGARYGCCPAKSKDSNGTSNR